MLPHYRVEFYEGLKATLAEENIDLRLLYGKIRKNPKKDEADLNWATFVTHSEVNILGRKFIYQHLPRSLYDSTLIILVQENLLLSNFVAAYRARQRGIRLAFWGHGTNFQDDPRSLGNRWKKKYSAMVDWWFAYTPGVAKLVSALPFPDERITTVNNAIDTRQLTTLRANIGEVEKVRLRSDLGIGEGPVGIYCGGMYAEKRLPFLFEACDTVKRRVHDFRVILIGAGADARLAIEFAAARDWVHYVGPKFGTERIPYFAISDVFLMPGLVGLAVLDSFALGTPIVTTKYPFHSPEIEYLEHGKNGLISEDNVSSYSQAVIDLVLDPYKLRSPRENARHSGEKYSVEAMISNFAEGIVRALASELRTRSGDSPQFAQSARFTL
jgi:glycosyltransferase involved in cell wall biosynthesis